MKFSKKLGAIALAVGLSLSVQAAEGPSRPSGPNYQSNVNSAHWWGYRVFWRITQHQHDSDCGHRVRPVAATQQTQTTQTSVSQVPELNAAGAGLSLALLGLFVGVMRERRKAQQ